MAHVSRLRKFVAATMVMVMAAGLAVDGAEARKKKKNPEPPPPPPPPLVVIPPRPYAPDQAPYGLPVPAIGADGLFVSPNRNITPAQITWNLRSAYNVGALNCPEPARSEITAGYRAFLRTHARGLATANRTVDAEFRKRHGARFVPQREAYMTGVYNHFAKPNTLPAFCNAVLAVSRDGKTVKPAELNAFAARSLPSIEIVFDDFYRRYAQWKAEINAWDAQYYAMFTERYKQAPYGPPNTAQVAVVASPAGPATPGQPVAQAGR